jgi:U-box domain
MNDFAAPDDLCCAITLEVFRDPVRLADGITYERQAIVAWLRKHNTSPITRVILTDKNIRMDWNMRYQVAEWLRGQDAD